MRALVQRVSEASIVVDGRAGGTIGRGFVVLVGVGEGDGEEQARALWGKIWRMRIFPDDAGRTNLSLADVGGSALVVSQFTLYASCRRGNRPSFADAAAPEDARRTYERFVELARADCPHVETGEFGADMQVSLVNDGPFTIWLDTDELAGPRRAG